MLLDSPTVCTRTRLSLYLHLSIESGSQCRPIPPLFLQKFPLLAHSCPRPWLSPSQSKWKDAISYMYFISFPSRMFLGSRQNFVFPQMTVPSGVAVLFTMYKKGSYSVLFPSQSLPNCLTFI